MNLLDGIKKNNTSVSINGSKYYETSYNSNLDVFTMVTRFNYEPNVIKLFNNALVENEELALANLLYILDIREGKGERRLFKIIYKFICNEYPNQALRILPFISELGRYDYLLVGINTKIENETIEVIKNQLNNDKTSDTPSLLAKWLPSIRTHKKNNSLAKKLVKLLNISEKEYRKLLAQLRSKLNIIEKNLTEFISNLKQNQYKIFSTNVVNGKSIKNVEKGEKFAIIVGNEGKGVSNEVNSLCDEFIYIEMNDKCESLNVAVATSIILYELSR